MPVDAIVALDFLLVSMKDVTVEAAQAAFKHIGGTLDCENSIAAARGYVKTQKLDGIIVDLDLKPALDLIAEMRRGKNARAFAFVCVSNEAEAAVALKQGANALLNRPVSAEAISAQVSSFRSILISERRRYQRHDVTLPVVVTLKDHLYQGIIENISQGGMAVRLPCVLPNASAVEFSFEVESGVSIAGHAQVRWANQEGLVGVEFQAFIDGRKYEFLAWLKNRSATTNP